MIQGAAYRVLYLFINTDVLSFAELCKRAGYGTDLGGYYLRSLVKGGLLEKIDRGQYAISAKGKHLLAITNDGRHSFVIRPRAAVALVARRGQRYALLERTIQPFIGVHEWPAASILHGEPLAAAAARTLQLRLGITGQPDFKGFFRRIDHFGEDIFDDKLFAVHTFEIPEGATIVTQGDTGKIIFAAAQSLPQIAHPAKSLLGIFAYAADKQRLPYLEQTYTLTEADLTAS